MISEKFVMHLLRMARPLVALLGILSTNTSYALPSGNPALPAFQDTNTVTNPVSCFDFCSFNDLAQIFEGQLNIGFYGDYIFSDNSRVWNVPVITKVTSSGVSGSPSITSTQEDTNFNVTDSNTHSSGLFASFVIPDNGNFCVPIFDISVTLKLGGLNHCYRLPLNAFRDFTSSPIVSTSQLTDGLIEMQTNYGFVWDLAVHKVLWKDGISFLGIGAEYRRASCPVKYVIVHSETHPEIYLGDPSGKCSYKEWGLHLSMATYLSESLIPYIGLGLGNASRQAPKDSFKPLEDQFTNFKFDVRKVSNYERIKFCCGITCYLADDLYYNIEGRWGGQKALSINAGFQF